MRTKVRKASPREEGLTAKVRRLPAVHPGEILSEDLMTPLGLSINGLARDLRVPVTRHLRNVAKLCRDLDVRRRAARLWDRHALCLEAIEMQRNCALHLSLDFVARVAGGDATGKIWGICREASPRPFDDNQAFHGFSIFTISRIFTTRSTLRSVYGLAALARPSTPFSHDVRRRANTESLHMPTIVRRSPGTWPQKRPQQFSDAVNCSENSTSKATPSLPWAQGVAGSNPVAPTIFGRSS